MTKRVGILANEFFDSRYGRMGGFGWLAMAAAHALRDSGEYEPIFVTSEFEMPRNVREIHGVPIIDRSGSSFSRALNLRNARIDHVLTVDWRPNYANALKAMIPTPVTVWVQDPRTSYDIKRISTLELPDSDESPAGVEFIDCSSLRGTVKLIQRFGSRVNIAGHANYLEEKVENTYGVRGLEYGFLGDPVDIRPVTRKMSGRPSLVFLGRLDPIKRPWLFTDLAEHFPDVDFHLLGQNHFQGAGGWQPAKFPTNINAPGHVGKLEKDRIVGEAWALVNTSIHEALPISFLEAFALKVPVVAMQNPDEVASQFGEFVGRWGGSGADGFGHLKAAVARILGDVERNELLGERAHAWVTKTHTKEVFVEQLRAIVGE